ncbi:MAG: response regulator [Desulfobacteraceae bacterium]|nr:response regulator [Desulfobacteraceae bacterium]
MDGSKKVLIVEDEKGIRVLLSDLLSSKGFEVSMARDGQESLDQLEDGRFDLVVTDIHMPRLDGIEMLKRMKKEGRKEKVIIMTGDSSDQRLRDADIPHIVTQLQKPFRIDFFLDLVIAATANTKSMSNMEIQSAVSGIA